MEDHCFLLCQPRAGGQRSSVKSSLKAGKQGGSVILDKAFQGCLALQTEKKEGRFIAKDFFLSTGHTFLLKFQWGKLSDSKLQVKVGHPIFLRVPFFFFSFLFILFLAVLGLCFCARALSSCGERGPLFIAVRGPLTIAASLVAEHRLQTRRLSNCGSRA